MDMLKAILIYLIAIAALVCSGPCWSKAKPVPIPSRPILTQVYTSTNCPACVKLLAELHSNRIKTVETRQKLETQPVPWFPACIYSDKVTDAGERVYKKTCYFKSPSVQVIELIEAKIEPKVTGSVQ